VGVANFATSRILLKENNRRKTDEREIGLGQRTFKQSLQKNSGLNTGNDGRV